MNNRKQFTFYSSFHSALKKIRKPTDRCIAYDAICAYALEGTLPDTSEMPDAVAIVFELIKPTLDASKRKSDNGKRRSKTEANREQTESKTETNCEQNRSKTETNCEQTVNEGESEIENELELELELELENELELELENECSPPKSPSNRKRGRKQKTDVPHKYGEYGWVKLTDAEYERLLKDLGERELNRCVTVVDESAQGNSNRNGWTDWNLVVRRCHREGWGSDKSNYSDRGVNGYGQSQDARTVQTGATKPPVLPGQVEL